MRNDSLSEKIRKAADPDDGLVSIHDVERIVRQHQADALQNATDILAAFKPEGERMKYEELEACYAMLFKQLVEVTSKHVEQPVEKPIPLAKAQAWPGVRNV